MADSPSSGGRREGPSTAGDPINCPSGCKLRHQLGDDLNTASCHCDEGYYDRERQVFYSGSDVRDGKSPETRRQYLKRIAGTDADPNMNRQGDYFIPRDGIRYDVLKRLREIYFVKEAQIWEHELNDQEGWLIRAHRRNYPWKAIVEYLQQESRYQDDTGHPCTERAPLSGALRSRRPSETQIALPSAGAVGTQASSSYSTAVSSARYPSRYSSQGETTQAYTQARQGTSESAGAGSGSPVTSTASAFPLHLFTPPHSAPGLPRPQRGQTGVMPPMSRTDREQLPIRPSQDAPWTPIGLMSERTQARSYRSSRAGGENSNEDDADEHPSSESRSYATTRAIEKRQNVNFLHDMYSSAGQHSLEEGASGANYIPISRRRETQPPVADRNDGRESSRDDLSDVPRALTEPADETPSQTARPPITSSLPPRTKGTAADEKQKRKGSRR
ncbi:uncharacterized protein Z520_05634 [Fonsecaea multimorphosa CBS 102226]|uniref:Uncharacterized protein n=1 Tax=Fonsecaea multimorphosa CBS 102226 TaxID=1442371 RepID=A0A0D2KNQ8_9EURO|nr:uncharacterized protein Z520_05634 [Fonsecaea multimorphosa CBS 102226]KIX98333.1 hypothetical protein Z520_05634 [Fonsecaea multimorphosa CBS 102226]OAL24528.1 hypothetical protein AYO22_05317 [Fonsecaea multimorphosa]